MKLILAVFASAVLLATLAPGLASDAYDKATSGKPDYTNKEFWPNVTGNEAFTIQEWPGGKTMVWAHPGQDGGGKRTRNPIDIWDPQNWLVNGEHPAEVVTDENTDLVLPDSEKPYTVSFMGVEGWNGTYRHITVGRNATMWTYQTKYYGNMWIKQGGNIWGSHGNTFAGGYHTFIRRDDGTLEDPQSGRIGQYFIVSKSQPDVTIEVVGGVSFLDRIPIRSGTVVIAKDSRLSPGRNATMIIEENATVALMDGAVLVKWANQIGQVDITVFGKLLGGLPDRPLTRPAFVGLSYQNTTGVKFFDRLSKPGQAGDLEKRISPLLVAKGGEIKSYSATPEGLLHLRLGGVDAKAWHMKGDAGYAAWIQSLSDDDRKYLSDQLDAIPRKVVALFQAGSEVDGLVLNDFQAGGLLMEEPGDLKTKWKRFSLGTGNDATGDAIVTRISSAKVVNHLKSSGGDYVIEGE